MTLPSSNRKSPSSANCCAPSDGAVCGEERVDRERTRKTSAMNLNGSFMPAFYSTVERERFILEGCAPHLTSAYPKNKGAGREARRLSAMRSEERRVGKECRAWWRREREVDREE